MSKAEGLFEDVGNCMNANHLKWTNCIVRCTDGAYSISQCHRNFFNMPESHSWIRCRQGFALEELSPTIQYILQTVT